MSNTTFEIGSVVQLNSGGPLMTVEEITVMGFLVCTWLDKEGKRHEHVFKPVMVREASDDPIV
jgi:uncharacterized protein YodC (DUF2158 family)